jgi:hypothetical protein
VTYLARFSKTRGFLRTCPAAADVNSGVWSFLGSKTNTCSSNGFTTTDDAAICSRSLTGRIRTHTLKLLSSSIFALNVWFRDDAEEVELEEVGRDFANVGRVERMPAIESIQTQSKFDSTLIPLRQSTGLFGARQSLARSRYKRSKHLRTNDGKRLPLLAVSF